MSFPSAKQVYSALKGLVPNYMKKAPRPTNDPILMVVDWGLRGDDGEVRIFETQGSVGSCGFTGLADDKITALKAMVERQNVPVSYSTYTRTDWKPGTALLDLDADGWKITNPAIPIHKIAERVRNDSRYLYWDKFGMAMMNNHLMFTPEVFQNETLKAEWHKRLEKAESEVGGREVTWVVKAFGYRGEKVVMGVTKEQLKTGTILGHETFAACVTPPSRCGVFLVQPQLEEPYTVYRSVVLLTSENLRFRVLGTYSKPHTPGRPSEMDGDVHPVPDSFDTEPLVEALMELQLAPSASIMDIYVKFASEGDYNKECLVRWYGLSAMQLLRPPASRELVVECSSVDGGINDVTGSYSQRYVRDSQDEKGERMFTPAPPGRQSGYSRITSVSTEGVVTTEYEHSFERGDDVEIRGRQRGAVVARVDTTTPRTFTVDTEVAEKRPDENMRATLCRFMVSDDADAYMSIIELEKDGDRLLCERCPIDLADGDKLRLRGFRQIADGREVTITNVNDSIQQTDFQIDANVMHNIDDEDSETGHAYIVITQDMANNMKARIDRYFS